MKPRERFLAAAKLGKPDLIPAAPYNGNFGAALAGIPISLYNSDAGRMAEAHIRTWETLGHDVVVAQSDQYYIAEGYGCAIEQPFDTTPHLVKPAGESLDQVDRLKLPDPYTDGRMPVYLDAVHKLRTHFGDEVAIRGPGTGPFSIASYLCGGTQQFLMDIAQAETDEDPEAQEKLFRVMDIASDGLISFLKAVLEAGSDVAQAGDSLASLSMISPTIYEKYVFPYERKVFTAIEALAREKDAVTVLHICGDTRRILPLMAQTGADVLEIDALVEMAEAKALTAGSVALMGNLDPTTVLLQGTPEEVRSRADHCLRSTQALDGGIILGSGCEVAPRTPVANLKALVEVAHTFCG